jgi:hypothetical protein
MWLKVVNKRDSRMPAGQSQPGLLFNRPQCVRFRDCPDGLDGQPLPVNLGIKRAPSIVFVLN